MPESGDLPQNPVYLTAFAVDKTYGLSRFLTAHIEPDAWLQSGRGKLFPVWLPVTIEAHLRRKAQGGAA